MKWLTLFLALVGMAQATPFLVCDPYPANLDQATKPVSFILTGIGQSPVSTPAFTNSDGTVQLHYDIFLLANGTYTVTAAAVNVLGGVSPASSPFNFVKGVPAIPINIRLVP